MVLPVLLIALLLVLGAAVAVYSVRADRARKTAAIVEVDRLYLAGRFRESADRAISALSSIQDPAACLRLRCRLARALVALEEYASACTLCDDAAEAAPDDAGRAEAEIEHARCLALMGEFDASLQMLSRIDAGALGDASRTQLELVATDVALSRLRFGDAERSLAAAFASAESGTTAEEAALGHARLQYLKGNFTQAAAEVNRVLEHLRGDDLQAQALLVLARILLDQERPDPVAAERSISRALVIARYPGLRAILTACDAVLSAHFGNTDDAMKSIRTAPGLTLSKRFASEAFCLTGDALRQLGRFVEARSQYQRALGVDSGSLEALWGLGRCAQMTGLFEVAESYFQLCVEAAPEHFLGRRSEDAIET